MVIDKENNNVEVKEPKITKTSKVPKNWNIGGVFWGLLLIVIGGLMLADNLDVLTVNWGELWRLWPLAIIAAGISALSVNNIAWKILSLLLAVSTIAAVVWVMVGGYSSNQSSLKTSEIEISKASDVIQSAKINVTGGATALTIDSLDQDSIVKSELISNVTTMSKKSMASGSVQIIDLTMDPSSNHRWWMGSIDNTWDIHLTRDLPIELSVNTGASDNKIDLSKVKTTSVIVNTGASSLDLKLGNTISDIDVEIESGASSITVGVPESSGVKLDITNGLVSSDLDELDKVDYASAANKINIEAKIGVSSFTIERY